MSEEVPLETGLRGVPVGYCVTSTVHPEKGLFYADHPVEKLVQWQPEKVIYLLYTGKEGSQEEIEKFSKDLKKRSFLSDRMQQEIDKLPVDGDPLKLFAAALIFCGIFEGTQNYREDCLNLIAKAPEITARIINLQGKFGKTPPSNPALGYMENFAHMLQLPKNENLAKVLTLFNILHYDHGGGNLSTFVGKAVASGLEDMYGSIAASMLALSGPRHGRANQECLHFVQEVLGCVGKEAKLSDVESFIRQKLEKKELIFGFGHAVLRVEDPRATIQYDFAQKHYRDNPLVKTALLIREAGVKVLKENPKISDPYPNVDAISGVLLSAVGFPYPEFYPLLFGLARTVGISIQIVYERLEAREGKGTPIIRPKYIYRKR